MVRAHRRPLILVLILILLVFSAGAFAAARTGIVPGPWSLALAVNSLKACGSGSGMIACARPTIQRLLKSHDASSVMDELSKDMSPPDCHYMGHVVGQEVYRKYQDVEPALTECSEACFSACTHGVIGEAFVQEAGLDDSDFDAAHMSAAQIQALGKRLCNSPSTCHGVGHALFQAYGGLDASLAACQSIESGTSIERCFSGAFMEYANQLQSKSAWKTFAGLPQPSSDALLSFCSARPQDQIFACFESFPTLVSAVHPGSPLPYVKGVCEGIEDAQARASCFSGYGMYNYVLVLADPRSAAGACALFPQLRDEESCIYGMVYKSVQFEQPDKLIAYCSAMSSADLKSRCYADVFSMLFAKGAASVLAAAQLCPAGDGACADVARDPSPDPRAP